MSNFVGLINSQSSQRNQYPLDPIALALQRSFYFSTTRWMDGTAHFLHLALANTQEAKADQFPLKDPTGNLALFSHARIDNREELLHLFDISPGCWAKTSDSMLILQAYQKWGESCIDHLIGDWCFAIWHHKENRLFVARDQHGHSALYYYQGNNFLIFSTSLKAVLLNPEVPKEPNSLKIAQILVSWNEYGTETCYKNIFRLPPAHWLKFERNELTTGQYWYLEHAPAIRYQKEEDYFDAFRELYTESVRCRLRSSGGIATTLSGGLDSGSVTALAARLLKDNHQPLHAYTSVPTHNVSKLFGNKRFGDETYYASSTASFIGNIQHHFIDAMEISPLQGLSQMLEIQDEPSHAAGNHFWIVSIMQQAFDKGNNVLLTGQGGNATVSWPTPGYVRSLTDHGFSLADLQHWESIKQKMIRPLMPQPFLNAYKTLKSGKNPWLSYSAINPSFAKEIQLSNKMKEKGYDPTFTLIKDSAKARFNILKPGSGIGGALWYANGESFGIEVRDPTLDKRILEFCLGIPDELYIKNGDDRMLLRRSMQGLMPDEVLWNTRRGRQAADIGYRIIQHKKEMDNAFLQMEHSPLCNQYLDIKKMKKVYLSLFKNVTAKNTVECTTILTRGIMTGLFLQRF
jgi:asparagine synthase (glutamine-hydrolysing)